MSSWPSSFSAWDISAVRRSCQTIAGATARPVLRSHSTTVSRWLVMPMAAISPARTPARSIASRQVAAVVDHRSEGSCSTQPERGKCWRNSSCPVATTARSSPNRIARVEVVPWSMART